MIKNKICFFNSVKSWGGGEKWHLDNALFLKNQGFDIVVFTNINSELKKHVQKNNLNHYEITVKKFSYLNLLKVNRLTKLFVELKIQTIIINQSADVKFAGISAKKAGIKNIIYRRGSAIAIKNHFINRYIFKNILTNIIANSEATKKTINSKNKNLFSENKIEVIYNGIDISDYRHKIEKKERENQIIIGNAGRLEKQKNHKFLIDLAYELNKTSLDYKIVIAGSGRLKDDLINYAKKKQVDNKIIFLGFVKDIKNFMHNIDFFVLTSLWEGFGYVLTEAMAANKAIVAFDLSSNPELVVDNYNGFLVKNDLKEFTEKVIVLSENKELRIQMGKNGRKLVEEKFDINISFQKFKEYMNQL